jgi:hypothetical protein
MVPFEQVLSSLAIVMQIAIGKVGFYIQFEQQEIQEKHRVPQKVWTWFSSKSDLLGVLVANEIVLYMWCSVKMKNPPASTMSFKFPLFNRASGTTDNGWIQQVCKTLLNMMGDVMAFFIINSRNGDNYIVHMVREKHLLCFLYMEQIITS